MGARETSVNAGLEADLGYLLVRASGAIVRAVNQALTPLGLKSRHMTLLQLAAAGPLPQREISAILGLDPSNVVGLVDDLQRAGLTVREPDPADRRNRLVAITDTGRAEYRQARKLADEVLDEFTSSLTDADRSRLESMLGSILTHA